jgi:hypothetical protein
MSKHTEGPWKVTESEDDLIYTYVVDEENRLIADTWAASCADVGVVSSDEAIANAKLIAAAPELIEALAKIGQ